MSPLHISPRSRLVALVLCFFAGFLGAHRFYVDKTGTALLMLITVGGFGLWTLVDFILIGLGSFADDRGYLLLRWSVDEPSSRFEETWSNPPEPDEPGRGELATRIDRIDGELKDLQSIMSRINRRLERPIA